MDYSEINKEVRAKIGTKGIKVWVFMNGGWHDIGWSTYNGSSYLHVLSDEKPAWSPKLLTLDKVLYSNHNQLIWWLSEQEWLPCPVPVWLKPSDVVYLLGERKPIYHPVQRKIANLILKRKNKMTQKAEPQKHRHYDLIMQWASDPTQAVWYWSGNEWQKSEHLMWNMKHYAIGEKPTTPPTLKATVKISLDTTELTIELPIGSRKEEIEKAILDKAVQFISHDYEFGE